MERQIITLPAAQRVGQEVVAGGDAGETNEGLTMVFPIPSGMILLEWGLGPNFLFSRGSNDDGHAAGGMCVTG